MPPRHKLFSINNLTALTYLGKMLAFIFSKLTASFGTLAVKITLLSPHTTVG